MLDMGIRGSVDKDKNFCKSLSQNVHETRAWVVSEVLENPKPRQQNRQLIPSLDQLGKSCRSPNLTGFLGDPPTKGPLFFLVFRNGSYQTDFLPKLSTQCKMDITDALIFRTVRRQRSLHCALG